VFFRKEWGETPYTRIEQTAIRNRGYKEGYDFTVFIPTDKPPTIPAWLPKTRLYFGLERFGLDGAAAVVENRIQELGGEPRIESVTDRAARLERANTLAVAKKRFRESEAGVRAAREAFDSLTNTLQELITQIAAENASLANLQLRKVHDNWLVSGVSLCMVVNWWCHFRNSLDDSGLTARVYKGVPRIPGLVHHWEEPQLLRELTFDYQLLTADNQGYAERTSESRSLSAPELAEHLLRIYLDASEHYGRR
jgi:hypothetical protein